MLIIHSGESTDMLLLLARSTATATVTATHTQQQVLQLQVAVVDTPPVHVVQGQDQLLEVPPATNNTQHVRSG